MKYVFNSGRYAVSFTVKKNGRDTKFEFDRRRVFIDTGNIATTGITVLEDEDYDLLLKENARFKEMVDKGELTLTEASQIETAESKAEALAKENAELKAKIAKQEKEVKSADADLAKENASLKKQLEALKKSKAKAE